MVSNIWQTGRFQSLAYDQTLSRCWQRCCLCWDMRTLASSIRQRIQYNDNPVPIVGNRCRYHASDLPGSGTLMTHVLQQSSHTHRVVPDVGSLSHHGWITNTLVPKCWNMDTIWFPVFGNTSSIRLVSICWKMYGYIHMYMFKVFPCIGSLGGHAWKHVMFTFQQLANYTFPTQVIDWQVPSC